MHQHRPPAEAAATMDILHSGRREIRGPRPRLLKVQKEPMKTMRKAPVIIYTLSPKKIHATPNEFMSVVQRLTGANTSPFPVPVPVPAAPSFRQNGITTRTSAMEGSSISWKMDPHMMAMMEAMEAASVPAPNPNNINHLFNPFPNHFDPNPLLHDNAAIMNTSIHYTNSHNNHNLTTTANPSTDNFVVNMPCPNTSDIFSTLFDL